MKFLDYLNSKKTKEENYTHQSIKFKCKYYIPEEETEILYNYIKEELNNNNNTFILERNNKDTKCIITDFDFKYPRINNLPDRRYTNEDIINIIDIYIHYIRKYFDIKNINWLTAFVFEKDKPYFNKNTNELKDGIHIIFPYIICNNSYQLQIRQDIIDDGELEKKLKHIKYTNSFSDVLDKSIVTNAWLLYGNKKENDKDPYIHTGRYRINEDNEIIEYGKTKDLLNLIKINSIRTHFPYKNDDLVNNMTPVLSNIKFDYDNNSNTINNNMTFTLDLTSGKYKQKKYEFIKSLVDIIDIKRVSDFDSWIKLGWCLRNINKHHKYLQLWINKSKLVDKYVNEAHDSCFKEWEKYNTNKKVLGEGTLRMWAKIDNPKKFKEIIKNSINALIVKACRKPNTTLYISKLIYEFYKNEYYCISEKNNEWYKYEKKFHKWCYLEQNDLTNIICEEFYPLIEEYGKTLEAEREKEIKKIELKYSNTNNNSDSDSDISSVSSNNTSIDNETKNEKIKEIKEKYKKLISKKEQLCDILLTKPKIKPIINHCCDLFIYKDDNNRSFDDILDNNTNLLVFKNGVYDLNCHKFRDGEPLDYTSLSTNIIYKEFNGNEKEIKEVNEFLKQILPIASVRKYVLKVLASCLCGENRDENAYFFTGEGGNGKSKFIELLLKTLGDYHCDLPSSILQNKRSEAEGANPMLLSSKAKRVVILQEPEERKLNGGLLKELTGGDVIKCRNLYSKKYHIFKPQFKMIIISNHLPEVNCDDGGVWRRIKNIYFPSRFVENPNPKNKYEFKIDNKLSKKMEKWPQAFMYILLENFKLYDTEGLKEPKEVIEKINEYKKQYDTISIWADDFIEQTDNEDDSINYSDAFRVYKEYVHNNLNQPNKSRPEFIKSMTKKYGKSNNDYIKKTWSYIKWKS